MLPVDLWMELGVCSYHPVLFPSANTVRGVVTSSSSGLSAKLSHGFESISRHQDSQSQRCSDIAELRSPVLMYAIILIVYSLVVAPCGGHSGMP